MPRLDATVFVVDDDEAMRDSLHWLLESMEFRVATFASGEEFLAAYDPRQAGCLVLDVRMPGMSGLELHDRLNASGVILPIVFITGHGEVPMAVAALKKGAVDFIEKPFAERDLLEIIERCLALDATRRREHAERERAQHKLAALTPREREVLDMVVAGRLNKIIADSLEISIKTVEVHRARVMEKLEARSVADLVQQVMVAQGGKLPPAPE
ncbi:Transcriptional regulatory protein TdiR [Burkholderiales bacterium]|nr:MAG: response regulator transcription factor [Burkholderiales bacterium]CAG0948104.1 Transcriptional regulatory protein TdiR [Burkholderiales bacterium]